MFVIFSHGQIGLSKNKKSAPADMAKLVIQAFVIFCDLAGVKTSV
jgi:hypothetical protein